MKQYEIVRQHDLKDCGVCSLLSIIKHYGGYVSLEKLRIDTHTSLEGTTAYHMIEAAKSYGFDSCGLHLKGLNELNDLVLPVIAHAKINELPHFVVIYKIGKKRIEIMDPAQGKVKMLKEDFVNIWTGNILQFYPRYSLPKTNPKNFFKSFLVQMIELEKNKVISIVFLTILFTLITIFTSFYFKIILNITNENNNSMLIYVSIPFFFLFITKIAIYYLKNYFKTVLNKNIDGHLYYSFINRLFLLPNYFIKNRTTGEIMLRLSELSNFKLFFSEVITTICIDLILSVGVGIILFNMSTKLFFLLCLFGFMYLIYGIISGKILYKRAYLVNEKEVCFQSQVGENLDTIITIKNLNVLESSLKKLEIKLFEFLEKNFKFNKSVLLTNTFSFLLEELLQFLIITIGLIEIINKNITLIDLITFESLLNYFINPFKNIVSLIPEYNFIKINLEKINEFYTLILEDDKVGLNDFKNGDIVIDNFSFSYNNYKSVFKDLNLTIKENSCVLLKGKSGCGKSTLCQLIGGLIEQKNSSIRIGNVNISDFSIKALRNNITYVGQKEFLIQETIQNNILFYRNINESLYRKVIEICKIEEIVSRKPLRYETFLLKDSLNLSGGEKQRIILARALLNKSKILILDESLSEVNEDMEIEIIKNIKKEFKDKTIIYVSHKNYEKYFNSIINFEALK